jgi:hypothetical protein
MRKYMKWVLLASALLAGQGCQSCGCRAPARSAAYPCDPCAPQTRFLHPLAPRSTVAAPPAGAVIVAPGGVPQQPAVVVPQNPIPSAPPPDVRNYVPPVDANPPAWQPGASANPPAAGDATRQPPLASSDNRAAPATQPAGIPQFTKVKNGVYSGQRPTALEGLDWLKTNNFRMALYLRGPNDSDDADRKQFEDRGIKFASLVVSPENLTLDIVDQFNHIVSEPADQPVFVYDKDGSLAGALWYLHFRMIDQQSDTDARTNAARLGLKEDNRDLWLAIQKILSGRQR